MNDASRRLISELGWHPSIARAYVEFNGHCAYCGEDVLSTRTGYALGALDHLLPKSKYPDLIDHESNHVLACTVCNSIKGNMDVLEAGEEPHRTLTERRHELIDRVRARIALEWLRLRAEWARAKGIIRP